MKQIPLLLKAEMVRQTLARNKNRTRRLVTARNSIVVPKVPFDCLDMSRAVIDQGPSPAGNPGPYWGVPYSHCDMSLVVRIYPRVHAGDVLVGKETLRYSNEGTPTRYAADNTPVMEDGESVPWEWLNATLPSIFMPLNMSRLNLPVTRVRGEFIQDISEEDAKAEGISLLGGWNADETTYGINYSGPFSLLWDSINARPNPVRSGGKITHYVSYPWEAVNEIREHRGLPWHVRGNHPVWVYDFEREVVK